MKRDILSIFLLFSLVAPLTITFFWLKHQKSTVRREVKQNMIAGLDKNELVLLKFTAQESQTKLHWEHSEEFEYNDQMYDIVETQIKGDTTYYWCWWDNEETKLNKQLDELLAYALGNNPQNKDSQKQLSDIFESFYHFEPGENAHAFSQFSPKNSHYGFSCIIFSFSPLVPPPEIG